MGLLAGILGGAVAGAGQGAVDYSKQEQQQQNRLDFAQYENQLAQERTAAAAQLQQQMARDQYMWTTTGPGADARRQGQLADLQFQGGDDYGSAAQDAATNEALAKSGAAANPDVLADNAKVSAATPQKLTPGEQIVVNGKLVSANTNPTMADVYTKGLRGTNGTQKAEMFEKGEYDKQLNKLTDSIGKSYTDPDGIPGTSNHVPSLQAAGADAFAHYQEQGIAPGQAYAKALSFTSLLNDKALALVGSAQGKAAKLTLPRAISIVQNAINAAPAPKP